MDSTAQPRHFLPGAGKTFQLGRITLTFKTTAEDNGGAYSLFESIEPPGSGAGLHRHPGYDETFIIREGHYEFQLGDKVLQLAAGDTVFVPRGMPHGFKSLGPEAGRQWCITSPGGLFDAFIAEVTEAMVDSGSPSSHDPATDFRAIAARHGTEFLA